MIIHWLTIRPGEEIHFQKCQLISCIITASAKAGIRTSGYQSVAMPAVAIRLFKVKVIFVVGWPGGQHSYCLRQTCEKFATYELSNFKKCYENSTFVKFLK